MQNKGKPYKLNSTSMLHTLSVIVGLIVTYRILSNGFIVFVCVRLMWVTVLVWGRGSGTRAELPSQNYFNSKQIRDLAKKLGSDA